MPTEVAFSSGGHDCGPGECSLGQALASMRVFGGPMYKCDGGVAFARYARAACMGPKVPYSGSQGVLKRCKRRSRA